jgi:dihydroflavonol-4-reductase
VPVPAALGLAAATATELAFSLVRRRPPICRELLRTVTHGHAYDGSRASYELGLRYTPVEETVRRTVAWYAEQGFLRGAGGARPSASPD